MENKDTQIEGLAYIAARYGMAWQAQEGNLKHLLSDPAILDHIPAVKALREENDELYDKVEQLELDEGIWPEWAEKLLKMARKYNGNDSSDDADGVCLLAEMEQAFDMFKEGYAIADRQTAALKERIAALESQLSALQAGGGEVGYVRTMNPKTGVGRIQLHYKADGYAEFPVGTKLYTQAPASVQPAIAGPCHRELISGLQSFLDRVIKHSETGVIHPELYEADADTLRLAIAELRRYDRINKQSPISAIPPGYAVVPDNTAQLFEVCFKAMFEVYATPADKFDSDTAWAHFMHHKIYRAYSDAQRVRAMLASAPLSSAPIAEQDAKDAARWRELMRHHGVFGEVGSGTLQYAICEYSHEKQHWYYLQADAVKTIDAAMLAAPADSSEGK